jgi:hypothetical protein
MRSVRPVSCITVLGDRPAGDRPAGAVGVGTAGAAGTGLAPLDTGLPEPEPEPGAPGGRPSRTMTQQLGASPRRISQDLVISARRTRLAPMNVPLLLSASSSSQWPPSTRMMA